MNNDLFTWVILPLLIFFSRIIDVSLGTLRVVYIAKGYKRLAPILGFFEVIIWVLAVRQVMVNLSNVVCLIAYGSGFAMGNYVGMWIEEKLSIGKVFFRVVFTKNPRSFITHLKKKDIGFTMVEGEGTRTKVKILFSVMKRKHLKGILDKLASSNRHAFYTVENIRSVKDPMVVAPGKTPFATLFRKFRKSK